MPQVSIIIPTYNRATYVTMAIDSVLTQTYTDYEIIVVDDGSTDNTQEVLRPYMDKIHYIFQSNKGVSAARNTGIRAATGEWIAFLDSDDCFHKDKLAIQMNFIRKHNLTICFTGVKVVQIAEVYNKNYSIDEEETETRVFADPFDLILNQETCPKLPTMIIEKSLLVSMGCFDETMKVAEDTKLIYGLALNEKFGYINYPLTIVNRNENRNGLANSCSQTASKYKQYHLQILNDTYKRIPKKNSRNFKRIQSMLGHYLSLDALDQCLLGNYTQARSCAFKSLQMRGHYKSYRRALFVLLLPWLVKYVRNINQNR
ncbi:MAG: glycosyltransferase family 2 protein [Phycisphaerae bacterium]|nr:glycosyltransferase family 2 protein [Phycisphaerae bacterium]